MKIRPANSQPRATDTGRAPVLSIAICIFAALFFLALPLSLFRFNYLPGDDALRHAAKAVSGKTWPEILVLRPGITIDHNPGWHWMLGLVHRAAGWDVKPLVQFSFVSMFFVFAISPLPWLRRPEAWLASIAAVFCVFWYFADRVMLGRPLLLTVAVTLTVLSMWTGRRAMSTRARIVATVILFALSAWIHGSWYLLVMIPGCFLLARHWKSSVLLFFCWLMGVVCGAILTGAPWTFLRQSAAIPFLALGVSSQSLVTEFEPFTGSYPVLFAAAGALLVRKWLRLGFNGITRDPVLWLAAAGWVLGFRVVRFWLDWGLPAFALWLAFQFEEFIRAKLAAQSWGRAGIALASAAVIYFSAGTDRNARWGGYQFDCLSASRPENAGWMPGPGGLLYAVDQTVFYETFYCNPRGDWRYVLGFEPSFMRDEDLAVFEELRRTRNALIACAPWVQRMKPADRLVLRAPSNIRPAFPQLEWHYAAEMTWIGRLPRNASVLKEGTK